MKVNLRVNRGSKHHTARAIVHGNGIRVQTRKALSNSVDIITFWNLTRVVTSDWERHGWTSEV